MRFGGINQCVFSGRCAFLRRRRNRRRRRFIHSWGGSPIFLFWKLLYKGGMAALRLPPLALSVPAQICNIATNRPMRRAAENGMYVCMYVCVCVCVFFERLILRQNLKEECCAIMYEKLCAMRRFERIDICANGNVLLLKNASGLYQVMAVYVCVCHTCVSRLILRQNLKEECSVQLCMRKCVCCEKI